MKNNIPWIEKYRPSTFNDIVLKNITRNILERMIEQQHIPNMIFYGPPGTGKTTTIINFIKKYHKKYEVGGQDTIIHLNASDERGIDIIRNHIYQFIKSKKLFGSGIKFVILDEVDSMTSNAQQCLKELITNTNDKIIFCLICNYLSRIDYTLQRNFFKIRFNTLPREDVNVFLKKICVKEDLDISYEYLNVIQDYYKSDLRSMINYLQQYKYQKSKKHINLIDNNHIHILLNIKEIDEFIEKCKEYTICFNISYYELLIRLVEHKIKEGSCHYERFKEFIHNRHIHPLLVLKHFFYLTNKN